MKERGWGRIVNIASAHGLRASPFKGPYVATKHAVVGLTKSVALEVAELGITCNAICPGYVWTPLVAAQVAEESRRLLGRLGSAELESVAVWRLEGYSVEEIAAKLGYAPRSVKRKLRVIRGLWEGEVGP